MAEYDVTPPPEPLANRVQLRTACSTERGRLIRFVSQLVYRIAGEWRVVVRYDHDAEAVGGHDVTRDGLHRDVYRDGQKVRTEPVTGPIPATKAFDYAEADLRENAERFIKRFEQWHDVRPGEDR